MYAKTGAVIDMTAKEASQILKSKYKDMSIVEYLNFVDFFAFALIANGKETESFAGGYDTVDKKTGSISTFNPTEDMASYMSADSIDINTLN